jgi:hypothetical protein
LDFGYQLIDSAKHLNWGDCLWIPKNKEDGQETDVVRIQEGRRLRRDK